MNDVCECTTEEFWQEMCKSGFMRVDLNTGANGNERYYCVAPPETVPGFLAYQAQGAFQALGLGVWEGPPEPTLKQRLSGFWERVWSRA